MKRVLNRLFRDSMDKYIDVYMKNLEWMLQGHEGQHTVIGKDKVPLGFWDTAEEAYGEGVRRYGPNTSFLLREVSREYVEHGRLGRPIAIYNLAPA